MTPKSQWLPTIKVSFWLTFHIHHGLASALCQTQVEGISISGKRDGGTCKGFSSVSWEVSMSLLRTPGLLNLFLMGWEVQCFHREGPDRKVSHRGLDVYF